MPNFMTKKVLIIPLDWGLGHATRCIPLIRSFKELGWQVDIGAEGAVASLITGELPEIKIHPITGYRITYGTNGKYFLWKMFTQLPRLLFSIYSERKWLECLLKNESYDLIISDNRYGLYHSKIPSVFITHQLRIQLPIKWMENTLERFHASLIKRFTICWIPDVMQEPSLAGSLSHSIHHSGLHKQYLGLLSRYSSPVESTDYKFEFCFLISGPEPQRGMLVQSIKSIANEFTSPSILLCGEPNVELQEQMGELCIQSHAKGEELLQIIQQSKYVVARSGYTTMMEMAALQKKCVFIPTPGQTEQEYLAHLHSGKGYAEAIQQDAFSFQLLKKSSQELVSSWPKYVLFNRNRLKELIELLEMETV